MSEIERAIAAIGRQLPSGAVLRDPDLLDAYAHDESEVEARLPSAVVRATSTEEVRAVLRGAYEHRVPVTPRAAGTGRVGGAVPLAGGVVLAMEGFRDAPEIDERNMVAVVRPGVVTGDLHAAAAQAGLLYAPDPNSWERCTLGGNVGTNAGGPRAFKYGSTRDYVLGLEAVTGDGTVLQLGKGTRKGVTGLDLTSLVVGSEGTLAVVTRITLKLLPAPERVVTLLAFLDDEASVAEVVRALAVRHLLPSCVELLDAETLDIARGQAGVAVPDGAKAMLLVELDGPEADVDRKLEVGGNAMLEAGAVDVLVARHGGDRERLWSARREMSRSLRRAGRHKLAEDVVVPLTRLGDLLTTCRKLAAEHGIRMPAYGHAGDGNLHVNFLWDDDGQRPAVDAAVAKLFETVVAMGGTLSGEHGIGELKLPYLPLEQAPELIDLQHRIKAQFDPRGILNPGKVLRAER